MYQTRSSVTKQNLDINVRKKQTLKMAAYFGEVFPKLKQNVHIQRVLP